ncbi:MAG: DUF6323 family protein [Eubacterium sp.]
MKDLFEVISIGENPMEVSSILGYNKKTEPYGLALTKEEALELMENRDESLRKYQRIEFGTPVLGKIIAAFCDSQYIWPSNYKETLKRLQDIFFSYKNEALDLLTDDELLTFMQEQFEGVCFGDLDYLESTCLERFAQAIHAGYRGYIRTGGHEEYEQFDEEPRWDKSLYLQVLKDLIWD